MVNFSFGRLGPTPAKVDDSSIHFGMFCCQELFSSNDLNWALFFSQLIVGGRGRMEPVSWTHCKFTIFRLLHVPAPALHTCRLYVFLHLFSTASLLQIVSYRDMATLSLCQHQKSRTFPFISLLLIRAHHRRGKKEEENIFLWDVERERERNLLCGKRRAWHCCVWEVGEAMADFSMWKVLRSKLFDVASGQLLCAVSAGQMLSERWRSFSCAMEKLQCLKSRCWASVWWSIWRFCNTWIPSRSTRVFFGTFDSAVPSLWHPTQSRDIHLFSCATLHLRRHCANATLKMFCCHRLASIGAVESMREKLKQSKKQRQPIRSEIVCLATPRTQQQRRRVEKSSMWNIFYFNIRLSVHTIGCVPGCRDLTRETVWIVVEFSAENRVKWNWEKVAKKITESENSAWKRKSRKLQLKTHRHLRWCE